MLELVNGNFKTIIITIFHMFKKVKESTNMLKRDMEDLEKDSSQTSRDEKQNT